MNGLAKGFLIFTLGGKRYGIDLRDVAEVLDSPTTFSIPRSPDFFMGVMNFHGRPVALLDLARCLGTGRAAQEGKVVVFDHRIGSLALWVDQVTGFVSDAAICGERPGDGMVVERVLDDGGGEIHQVSPEYLLTRIENVMSGRG